jgi:hypothetical protein
VYERPKKEPFLDIGLLFKSLFSPKEAFEELYDHTSGRQGIVLALTFILITAVISIIASIAILGDIDDPGDSPIPTSSDGSVLSAVSTALISLVMFFLSAYMIHYFLSQGKARRPDKDKTTGFLGYSMFPFFLIGIPLTIASLILVASIDTEAFENEDPDIAMEALGEICAPLLMVLVLSAIAFVWCIWVHSHAQSVANDTAKGTAFGYILLTWILVGILSSVLGYVIDLASG